MKIEKKKKKKIQLFYKKSGNCQNIIYSIQ